MALLLLSAFPTRSFRAQPSERKLSPREYVEIHKDDAVKEMQMFGIPASITLAQGMLESDNGNSDLAVYANNHFGIKCHEDWTGPSFVKDDDTKDECFRKYKTVLESYSDHSRFLKSRNRYAPLFELKSNDYKGWARGLKETGYATDPRYTERLLEIIEKNKLYDYDQEVALASLQPKPDLTENLKVKPSSTKRSIQYISERPFIIARKGDSFSSLAKEYEKGTWELPRYNEVDKHSTPVPGQKVYLGPKRRRGSEAFHTVKSGETMYSISQDYCIKLKFLYRRNKLTPGSEPHPGEVLYLRGKKKH
ncbi:MAG TPA: glucosaminidase domain-containing protein [Bacteroidia bacterium]|nr:glucosaminidase domain-containing protein [Bacteroidia bacterium]